MLSITTKSPYAVRALDRARPQRRRRPGADRRARQAPRHPRPVPRAALRRAPAGRDPEVPARRQGRLLLRPRPADVTVLEVVELLDGPFGAGAESVFSEAAAAARAILQNATIADVVERENRDAGAHMYYI